MSNWMIYGATGYTGVLVAEEAVKRGHKPILAGRSEKKLKPLAERLSLAYRAFDLSNIDAIVSAITDVDVIYHAAGPFIHTSDPMIQACLRAKVHYLDITGEYSVFENSFSYDAQAKEAGIAIISGVGFDVVPTDCLCEYVADQLPDATELEVGINAISKASAGTTKSMIEMMGTGGRIRRDGDLMFHPFGKGTKKIRFIDKEWMTVIVPWGDVSTAYRTTNIPNITTYMVFPKREIKIMGLVGGLSTHVMSIGFIKKGMQKLVDWFIDGPDEALRQSGKCYVYAKVTNPSGNSVEAWMETAEGYLYTALIGVRSVEQMLDSSVIGATTPALAFGVDFALEVDGTKRYDSLDN